MEKKTKQTALAVLEKHGFELALPDEDVAAAYAEEMDGLGSIPFDRVKIPSGGALSFEVPGDGDEPDVVPEITGIIVDHHAVNAYWEGAYDGSANPPVCLSNDGRVGITQGGEVRSCEACPLNKYGSSPRGGKACKNMHHLYILVSGRPIPIVLVLPPTSITAWRNYLGRALVVKGKRPYMVLTKITLRREKNASGIAYSQAVFTKVADLTKAECDMLRPVAESFKAMIRGDKTQTPSGPVQSAPEAGLSEVMPDEEIPF